MLECFVVSMPSIVVFKIKSGAALWSLAGAKHLGSLIPREWFFYFRSCVSL
jgi:hypothetical protein